MYRTKKGIQSAPEGSARRSAYCENKSRSVWQFVRELNGSNLNQTNQTSEIPWDPNTIFSDFNRFVIERKSFSCIISFNSNLFF